MPDERYDYADFIKLRLVINLYCSRQRTIMYSLEVRNGLYDIERGAEKWGVTPRREIIIVLVDVSPVL